MNNVNYTENNPNGGYQVQVGEIDLKRREIDVVSGCFHGTCDKKTQHSLNRLKLSGLMY